MKKLRFCKQLILSLLTATLFTASMASPLAAQEAPPAGQAVPLPAGAVPVFGGVPGMVLPPKEKLGGAKQYQLMSLYAIEIRRIDESAKLEDAQKTKLSVGAKGLAKKRTQEFIRNMAMMMEPIPVGGPAPAAKQKDSEPETKIAEVQSFADIDANTRSMLDFTISPEPKPFDDDNWLKLVKSVLKPEQYASYEQSIAAQKLNSDQAMVNAGVATLSLELVLSKDQASKLAALVMEQVTKPKADPADQASEGNFVMGMVNMEGMSFMMYLAKVDNSSLGEVLDRQQFEMMEFRLASMRSMLGAMGEMPADGYIIEK